MSLFRSEVFEEKKPKLYGKVLIPTSVPYWVMSGLFAAALVLFIVIGWFGSYSRNEQVTGLLAPTSGLVKIQSIKPGTISKLYVEQGARVNKGERLVSVSADTIGSEGQSAYQFGIEAISKKLEILELRKQQEEARLATDISKFDAESLISTQNIKMLEDRLALQSEIAISARKTFEDSGGLRQKGHISRVEFETRKQFHLQTQQQLGVLEHELAVAKSRVSDLELKRQQRQLDFEQTIGQLDTESLSLQQQQIEIAKDKKFELQSPVAGTVTSVSTFVGRNIKPHEPIITVLPEGSNLQVVLYVPSRAIGFIEAGQEVKLSYDAFPYQQYGTFHATISSVTRTMLLPEEIDTGYIFKEPVYRVLATMKQDFIQVGEEKFPLRPGMRLNATIVLERFSVFGWLLQSVRGVGGQA